MAAPVLSVLGFHEPRSPVPARRLTREFPATPGVYVHIPFCATLCPFCPYNKVIYRRSRAEEYLRLLEREAAAYLAQEPGPFPSLYIGGGTPTLCLDGLERLVRSIPVSGERAIEVLPTHMTPSGATRLESLGFDAVSLGVQSFDPGVLRRLRRPTSVEANRRALETAVGRFDCVDVDLIFDTAFDDPGILLDDLVLCFAAGVDQVSTYPLVRFGYTPLDGAAADLQSEHRVLREAAALAEAHGYRRRSVWTFNRVGSASYSSITRPYLLGLGAGAASFAGRLFTVNHFSVDLYAAAVGSGRLPIARMARLGPSAAALYRAFWQAYTGSFPFRSEDPLLGHPLVGGVRLVAAAAGWSRRDGADTSLTTRGYDRYHDLERWVTARLIEPLWGELMGEHSETADSVADDRRPSSVR